MPGLLTRGLSALLAAAAAAGTIAASPAAHASPVRVSPGDRIHVGDATCSLAYTYRSHATGRTYAVTAAHCRQAGGTTATTDRGAVGTFLRSSADPAGTGGTDFALLDFGTTAQPGQFLNGRPIVYGLARPQPGQVICRAGATTGEHCGVVQSARGPMQYLTAPGMQPCAGGDSGGAVWTPRNGGAHIIGVWLGGVTLPGGGDLGRFAGLQDGFAALGLI